MLFNLLAQRSSKGEHRRGKLWHIYKRYICRIFGVNGKCVESAVSITISRCTHCGNRSFLTASKQGQATISIRDDYSTMHRKSFPWWSCTSLVPWKPISALWSIIELPVSVAHSYGSWSATSWLCLWLIVLRNLIQQCSLLAGLCFSTLSSNHCIHWHIRRFSTLFGWHYLDHQHQRRHNPQ